MWNWAIWGALAAGGAASLGALVFLAVRILQAWRDFKRTRRHLSKTLDRVAEQGELTAQKAAQAADTAELEQSLARLRVSLARLAVLRAALQDAQETFARVTSLVPRK